MNDQVASLRLIAAPSSSCWLNGVLSARSVRIIEQDRQQQHDAQECVEPVGIPPGERDADARHSEDERPNRGANHGPIATRQAAAANDGGDDVDELLADALALQRRSETQRRHDADQPRRARRGHEQRDLHPVDRHPHAARRFDVAPHGEDPASVVGAEQDPGGDQRDDDPG